VKEELVAVRPLTVTTKVPVVAADGTATTMPVPLHCVTVAVVPLSFTVLPPWLAPKPFPVMRILVPTAPEFGDRLAILGATVNVDPLLATPPALTTTLPVEAPAGTVAVIEVELHAVVVAVVPLNFTVPVPCEPKFCPLIVTVVPTVPTFGPKLLMLGAAVTVNVAPPDATPADVTTTFPVVVPAGTVAVIELELQAVVVAVVPLNFTVPCCRPPKFCPAMVTVAPIAPAFGVKLVMLGANVTVNGTPIDGTPPAVTTTFPVVAPAGTVAVMEVAVHAVVVAVVLLNFNVPVACAPKFCPTMVTVAPTAPAFGVTLVIFGAGVTVNALPLLFTPPTLTTTFPVVAPSGTVTAIELALQGP